MKIKETIAITLMSIGLLFVGAGIFYADYRWETKTYNNALRYAEEHDCTCYGSKGSIAFVFSNGASLLTLPVVS